jgi:hypothetical protein
MVNATRAIYVISLMKRRYSAGSSSPNASADVPRGAILSFFFFNK